MTDRFDWLELEKIKSNPPSGAYKPAQQPWDAASFYRAGCEMREHGYLHSAIPYFEKAVALSDQHYDAWLALIDALVHTGNLDIADMRSKEALDNYRLVRPFYAARALLLAHKGQFDEAFSLSNVSCSKEEPHWYAFCVRGEILLLKDVEQRLDAMIFFEASLECPGVDWQAYLMAGNALLEAHLPAMAAGMFAEAAHLNPRASACWLGLGDSFLALRLYDQAMFYYQRMTELQPKHEIAIERQKRCAPLGYGLMKVLVPRALQGRWKSKFGAILRKERLGR
ncbi:MAG: tetratricopeptide repeat protein [FCB group bacterium]|jgi:tetratricopeptide (TPR) repeat protein|nr:tetratricopeptide repeat protein [FCB group bacterium]